MNNQFEIANYPNSEPGKLLIGKRWVWSRNDISKVYPTDEYTLNYKFADFSNVSNTISLTASKIDAAHVIEVAAATTANFTGADYFVSVDIVRDSDGELITIDELSIEVASSESGKASHVYKVLMAVRSLIEGKASKDELSVSINGKSLERFSPSDWVKIEADYSFKWEREKEKLALSNGRKTNKRILIRMGA